LCWNQWTSLWSAEVYASTWYGDESGIPTATETHTTTYSPQPGTTWTSSDIWTEISTIMQGAYAITTETIPRSYLETVSEPGQSATTATWTETDVFYSTMGSIPNASTLTQPPCVLPSYVPQCQSSWATYLSNYGNYSYTAPRCPAATVDNDLCWSFRDAYVDANSDYDTKQFAPFSRGYTVKTWISGTPIWAWPTQSTLAPSCTLGCARCAMTGGTIQLLYWPRGTTYQTAAGPLIAETDGTTLTYPTVGVRPCPLQ